MQVNLSPGRKMDSKTVVELILTAVIAAFAGATWWATKTYAYVTGLALFIQATKEIVGAGQGIDRGMAKQTMRAIRKRFPRVYDDMRACMNPGSRDEVERENL